MQGTPEQNIAMLEAQIDQDELNADQLRTLPSSSLILLLENTAKLHGGMQMNLMLLIKEGVEGFEAEHVDKFQALADRVSTRLDIVTNEVDNRLPLPTQPESLN